MDAFGGALLRKLESDPQDAKPYVDELVTSLGLTLSERDYDMATRLMKLQEDGADFVAVGLLRREDDEHRQASSGRCQAVREYRRAAISRPCWLGWLAGYAASVAAGPVVGGGVTGRSRLAFRWQGRR